jgi:pimeloyl-ACP methyl ester carboxylesterase
VINATLAVRPEIAIPILKAVFSWDPTAAMREIKVPIRAINADRVPTDLPVNRKYAPQFDVMIIKGTGHYPMLEDPARFNQMLAEILRNLPRM